MAKGSFIFAMNRRKAIAVTEAEEVTVELAKSAVFMSRQFCVALI